MKRTSTMMKVLFLVTSLFTFVLPITLKIDTLLL
jgi:hypothetical protein